MVAPGTHPIYQEYAEALDLVEAKAHDYAEDDNVFSNFEFAAQVAGVETEQVFAVLLGVKVARLGQLIGKGKTPNFESIDDTLLDTMNYAGLLKAYLRLHAEVQTVKDAFEAAEEEQREPTAWETYKSEKEADWRAERSQAVEDEGPVDLEVGSIVRVKGHQTITYRIVEMNDRLRSIDAVPSEDWEDTLGKAVRSFAAERLELA